MIAFTNESSFCLFQPRCYKSAAVKRSGRVGKQKGDEFRPQIEFHFVDSVAEERSLGKTVSAPNLVGLITEKISLLVLQIKSKSKSPKSLKKSHNYVSHQLSRLDYQQLEISLMIL